jgi:drug/metabolite transporter (DMT)-like permease
VIGRTYILAALLAAFLFGTTTPVAKLLLGEISPLLLAGLLYLGSGCGLLIARVIRDRSWRAVRISRSELLSFAGAILFGGVLAPLLLMLGLKQTAAASASLLLNLEGVFTVAMAWWIFKENAGSRVVLGMLCIVAGGVALTWSAGGSSDYRGAALIAAACFCWAIDNNLTRNVASLDAVLLGGGKGLVAGAVNVSLAVAGGVTLPRFQIASEAMVTGLFGYGISLVLFVLALRGLGAARTSAYFSTAPFVGAIAAAILGEPISPTLWIAGGLMSLGVWLHATEQHSHIHSHEAMDHEHSHIHDEHHRHEHDFPWDGKEPHSHPHHHEPIEHAHAHFPDIHHRHAH